MLVVHVHVHVKPERVDDFKAATLQNAKCSLKEPGVVRFDVIQSQASPSYFVLVEVYKDAEAPLAHKQTEHYETWRDSVADMMQRPRESHKFDALFPTPAGWLSDE